MHAAADPSRKAESPKAPLQRTDSSYDRTKVENPSLKSEWAPGPVALSRTVVRSGPPWLENTRPSQHAQYSEHGHVIRGIRPGCAEGAKAERPAGHFMGAARRPPLCRPNAQLAAVAGLHLRLVGEHGAGGGVALAAEQALPPPRLPVMLRRAPGLHQTSSAAAAAHTPSRHLTAVPERHSCGGPHSAPGLPRLTTVGWHPVRAVVRGSRS